MICRNEIGVKTVTTANQIRKEIGDIGFPYHVRKWRDGEIWVMPEFGSLDRCEQLCNALHVAGYRTAMNGKPGTAGQWVIEVTQ